MNIREKIFCRVLVALLLTVGANPSATAQGDHKTDTLECHIVGFNVGMKIPSTRFEPLCPTLHELWVERYI